MKIYGETTGKKNKTVIKQTKEKAQKHVTEEKINIWRKKIKQCSLWKKFEIYALIRW